jgi:hypothetical protein
MRPARRALAPSDGPPGRWARRRRGGCLRGGRRRGLGLARGRVGRCGARRAHVPGPSARQLARLRLAAVHERPKDAVEHGLRDARSRGELADARPRTLVEGAQDRVAVGAPSRALRRCGALGSGRLGRSAPFDAPVPAPAGRRRLRRPVVVERAAVRLSSKRSRSSRWIRSRRSAISLGSCAWEAGGRSGPLERSGGSSSAGILNRCGGAATPRSAVPGSRPRDCGQQVAAI